MVKIKKITKVLPAFFTSLLIAFFPKCPLCWAVYMSMFGALGLSKLPYMPWLLPLLLLVLGIHLLMLYKKIVQKGMVPFVISLSGSALLIAGRLFLPSSQWLAIAGFVLIASASLLNSFLSNRSVQMA